MAEYDSGEYMLQDLVSCDSNDSNNQFVFELGTGAVVKAWDEVFLAIADKHLGPGLALEILSSPDYAYGSQGSLPHVPPNSFMLFSIHVLSLREARKSVKTYLQECEAAEKEFADKLLDPNTSADAYLHMLKLLKYVSFTDPEEQKLILSKKFEYHFNRATCLLRIKKLAEAKKSCDKALSIEPTNHHAISTRAAIFDKMGLHNRAREELQRLRRYKS